MVSNDFLDYLNTFDLICLTETFVDAGFEITVLKDFSVFMAPARKLSRQGRRSGGVVVFIRKCVAHFFKQVNVRFDNFVVFEASKELLNVDKPVLFIFLYIPPRESPAYTQTTDGVGIELIEYCVSDLYETRGDFFFFLCGDFNARTGQENGRGLSESLSVSGEEDCVFERSSRDLDRNSFGTQLLILCNALQCSILNGIRIFGFDDSETYVSQTGSSTIDYFIVSNELCKQEILDSLVVDSNCVESDHLPVTLTLRLSARAPKMKYETEKVTWIEKLCWDKEKVPEFLEVLSSAAVQTEIRQARASVSSDINKAIDALVGCLEKASVCMVRRVKVGGTRKLTEWFDRDCFSQRKECRSKLRRFKQTRLAEDRKNYVNARCAYRKLLSEKSQSFKRNKAQRLADSIDDPKQFWKEVRACIGLGKKQNIGNNITKVQWLEHFKTVFNSGINEGESESERWEQSGEEHLPDIDSLDCPISEDEVIESIRKLKHGKASGLDNVLAEMLKAGGNLLTGFLSEYFNEIFRSGSYPDMWTKAIIVPIHKKGDTGVADNFRGVSLLSLIGKCYTSILNKRLYGWLEDNDKIAETQAGFRKGYSTTDHVFTLYAITQKYLSQRGGKVYVAFIDLRKAFDSVKRDTLLNMLCSAGVSSTFVNAVKAIYSKVVSCVRVNGEFTDMFDCPQGLRQGCVLSPTLFSIIINEFATSVANEGKHGIQLLPGLIELFILLFADDLALMSCSPHGLQVQLDCVHRLCMELGLNINTDKSKIMVFRKGGFLGRHEKWSVDGHQLEVVNRYVYLGFTFSTSMSLHESANQLALKGRRALFHVLRVQNRLEQMTRNTFFKIFDTKIQPILLYATEVWGVLKDNNPAEKVHLLACKRFLNVAARTPNKMVYGELGRHPLQINCYIRAVKYWFRLLRMDSERLPNQAYRMLRNLDSCGKCNWASQIRSILQSLGFGYVWLAQGIARENCFLRMFKQRLTDVFRQDWMAGVNSSDRFAQYRKFKFVFDSEKYLDCIRQKCFRDAFVRMRLGISDINVHKNRYKRSDLHASNDCPFCPGMEENEHHLWFRCPKYNGIRPNVMKSIEPHQESTQFARLMSSNDDLTIRKVAWYLYKAFELRKRAADTLGQ